MKTIWHSGFYYDEEHDLTYINTDRLKNEDRLRLIHILGFELVDDEETGSYILEEVRYQMSTRKPRGLAPWMNRPLMRNSFSFYV